MILLTRRLVIYTGIFFVSCSGSNSTGRQDGNSNGNENFSNYLALKEKALSGSEGTDTTFLQFRFGMSPAQVKERLEFLEKDSTVTYDYDQKEYTYDIHTGREGALSKIQCVIIPKYFQDQLYSIEVEAINENTVSPLIAETIKEKYGAETVKYKLNESSPDIYVWFIGGVEIKVNELVGGALLSYTNLSRAKALNKEDQNKSDKDKAKTQSEL